MTTFSLYKKLEQLTPDLKIEVQNFIEFLLDKNKSNKEVQAKKRKFGSLKGKIHLSKDFDDLVDDFKEYMWWITC